MVTWTTLEHNVWIYFEQMTQVRQMALSERLLTHGLGPGACGMTNNGRLMAPWDKQFLFANQVVPSTSM